MSKREPHWVKLFLRNLAQTGNVRMAAEGAGVDFTTAYGRRKRHSDFAEAWEGALRAHASRSADGERQPGPSTSYAGPPPRSGEDVVTRPDGKMIKGSDARWGKRAEEVFLAELTMSANVKRAAAAAGFSGAAVYKRRVKDRHLAAAWDAAIEVGKARVQAFLVEAASRTFDPDELPVAEGHEVPKVSVSEAINIAKLKAGPSLPASGSWDEQEEPDEDYMKGVRESILDKLQRLKERNLEEYGEAGWIEWELPPGPKGAPGLTVWLPPDWRLVGPEG